MKKISNNEVQILELNILKEFDLICKKYNLGYYMIGGTMLGAIRHKGFIPWDDDIDIAMMREDYDKLLDLRNKGEISLEICNFQNDKSIEVVLSRVYIKNTYFQNKYLPKMNIHNEWYFDIFPLDNVPDDYKLAKKQEREIIFIRKIINLKLQNIKHEDKKFFLKKIFQTLLFLFPINFWLKKLDRIMKKYKNFETKMVCSMASGISYSKQSFDRDIYGSKTLYTFEEYSFYGVKEFDKYLSQLYGANYMIIPEKENRMRPHDIFLLENWENIK